jgi:hypothetical protein
VAGDAGNQRLVSFSVPVQYPGSKNFHPVSTVYPLRLNVPARFGRFFGFCGWWRRRLFNRNFHSNRFVFTEKSATVKTGGTRSAENGPVVSIGNT